MSRKKSRAKLQRVLIMAGGTGGHVFPGLALAKYMREHGITVHWLGTAQGLEAKVVPAAHIPFHLIPVYGLRGKGWCALLKAPLQILRAIYLARSVIRQVNPQLVIGMGGFVSGPGGFAAWLSGIPLIIHEQNAKAGLTNKLLAVLAKKVLAGFPGAFPSAAKVNVTGNPVRDELMQLPAPIQRFQHDGPMRLLILGGSLGAQVFNETVPLALALLAIEDRPQIWQQTGEKHIAKTQSAYAQAGMTIDGVAVRVQPFIEQMAAAYAWADVILCRAGALTVAELSTVGLGAIFVPFPHAVDDHQTANAQQMVESGAAICVQQTLFTPSYLASLLSEWVHDKSRWLAMANAAYALRKEKVVEEIFNLCEKVLEG